MAGVVSEGGEIQFGTSLISSVDLHYSCVCVCVRMYSYYVVPIFTNLTCVL